MPPTISHLWMQTLTGSDYTSDPSIPRNLTRCAVPDFHYHSILSLCIDNNLLGSLRFLRSLRFFLRKVVGKKVEKKVGKKVGKKVEKKVGKKVGKKNLKTRKKSSEEKSSAKSAWHLLCSVRLSPLKHWISAPVSLLSKHFLLCDSDTFSVIRL